ncbi:host cell division inhibitor Icd-like protein [Volucribacter psittacicida]|uniref:host cell division inhibitor Icd-like protein n=1 Tax=Volucribacter psittacicida TaxID=203482 RepID=UPI001FB2CE0C|nr:host cell division inhibitor Icd-like protein [Volucribacter psittacicida]
MTNDRNLNYIRTALAKSNAEPENSNLYKANSTPKACFFIRSIRTPQARQRRHSMVAYSGKGFALCCVPCIAVSQPVIRYRPEPENFQAVTLNNQYKDIAEMIYQFLGVSRQHYDPAQAEQIRILAESENQARVYLARDYVLILLGRLPNSAKNDRTLVIKGGVYA